MPLQARLLDHRNVWADLRADLQVDHQAGPKK
jgi:hypothetical protein